MLRKILVGAAAFAALGLSACGGEKKDAAVDAATTEAAAPAN
jgi:hypothetical protein